MSLVKGFLMNEADYKTNLETCFVIDKFLQKMDNKESRVKTVLKMGILDRLAELLDCNVDEEVTEHLLNIYLYLSRRSDFDVREIVSERFIDSIKGHLSSDYCRNREKAMDIISNCFDRDEAKNVCDDLIDQQSVYLLCGYLEEVSRDTFYALRCLSSFVKSYNTVLISYLIEEQNIIITVFKLLREKNLTLQALIFIKNLLEYGEIISNKEGNPIANQFEKDDYANELFDLQSSSSGEEYNKCTEIINTWFEEEEDESF